MSRIVKHDKSEPYKVEQGGQTAWVCGCGLSGKKPLCDGSHKKTADEEAGALYVYAGQDRLRIPTEY